MTKQLLIIYYTGTGNTEMMAEAIAKGAQELGLGVTVQSIEECELDDLVKADGIVIGSPTYFSNMAWQVKKLVDESITLYRRDHQLQDKVGGCFTSSGIKVDGKDCLNAIKLAFGLHHRMTMVPGIVRASGDNPKEVRKMCRRYGMKIAQRMLSQ